MAVVISDVVDGNDVGMIERGCGSGLKFEAAQAILIVNKFGLEQLESDFPLQALVGCPINFPHSTGADAFVYPIVTQELASHCRGET